MSQIRILFLHAGAEMYGADKVLLDLIRGLDKTRYNIYVVLPCDGVLVEELKKTGATVCVVPYPIMRRKFFNPKGIVSFISNYFKYSHEIAVLARKWKIQLIHTNTSAVLEGCYISKALKIPQLWEVHEIIVNPKIMFYLTALWISLFSDKVVTVSNASKMHLIRSGFYKKKKIEVIYNGVDSERFNPDRDAGYLRNELGIPEKALIIGMIGRVNSWKGQEDLLQAANIVMKDNPDVYTVFAGAAYEGEEWREDKLNRAITESAYSNRIINMGYRTDVESIHALFDVFVLPSTNPDPLPTVVLEAMASGKPVVAYRHGGVCEMVREGKNGLFADPGSPTDLAEKIKTVLEDETLRRSMGEYSRKRVMEKFSMERYVGNYTREYEKQYSINSRRTYNDSRM